MQRMVVALTFFSMAAGAASFNYAAVEISGNPSLSFGSVVAGATAELSLQVTNFGNQPATAIVGASLPAPFAYKGGVYPGTGGTCSAVLASHAACFLIVQFSPVSEASTSVVIQLSYHDGSTASFASGRLTASGIAPASIAISEEALCDFGSTIPKEPLDKTVTISNSGDAAATGLEAAVADLSGSFSYTGGAYPGRGGSCGNFLAGATTCTVVLRFSPEGEGRQSGTLPLSYHDGIASRSVEISLAGFGLAPALRLNAGN